MHLNTALVLHGDDQLDLSIQSDIEEALYNGFHSFMRVKIAALGSGAKSISGVENLDEVCYFLCCIVCLNFVWLLGRAGKNKFFIW